MHQLSRLSVKMLLHANSVHQAYAAHLCCDANSCCVGKVLRLMRQPSFESSVQSDYQVHCFPVQQGLVQKQLMSYLGPISGSLLVLLDCSLVDDSPSPDSYMVVLWEHPAVEVW